MRLPLWLSPRRRAKHGTGWGEAMTEYLRTILTGQFEASLAMLHQCVRLCSPEHWEGVIANRTFQRNAYHTLFFVDLYLSPREDAFKLRALHRRGGWMEPGGEAPRIGLPKDDTLEYVDICRAKMLETMASETVGAFEARRDSRGFPFPAASCTSTTSGTSSTTRVR